MSVIQLPKAAWSRLTPGRRTRAVNACRSAARRIFGRYGYLARTGRWWGRECATLGIDLARVTRHARYKHPTATLRVVVALTGIAGLLVLLAPGTAARVALWGVFWYVVTAAVTAVPRGRARIRFELRHAVRAVTRTRYPVRLRRRRWKPLRQRLVSVDIPVPSTWRHGSEDRRAQLDDEIAFRMRGHGSYLLDWPTTRSGVEIARVYAAPELPDQLPADDWHATGGLVLGEAAADAAALPCTEWIAGRLMAIWNWARDAHLLLAGATGAGKTTDLIWIARQTLHVGAMLAMLDGKKVGHLLRLKGRQGVLGIAVTEAQWKTTLARVLDIQRKRYQAYQRFNAGKGKDPRPGWTPIVLLIDELVTLLRFCPDLEDDINEVIEQGREAHVHAVVSVLRADTATGLSGLVRNSCTARLQLGAPDPHGAQMMFEGQWREAMRGDDADNPGRGRARLGMGVLRLHCPYVAHPAEHPADADAWMPPHADAHTATTTPPAGSNDHDTGHTAQHAEVLALTTRPKRRGTSD